jgi:hypothetical protein
VNRRLDRLALHIDKVIVGASIIFVTYAFIYFY